MAVLVAQPASTRGATLTAFGFAILVSLGSVLGLALEVPDATRNEVTVFVLTNAMISSLVFGISQTLLEIWRQVQPRS
jgi:hypothetical protein